MVDDTDKLLKLVTELNSEISRTNTSTLTPEQLRRVAEIEKLAPRRERQDEDLSRHHAGFSGPFASCPRFAPVIIARGLLAGALRKLGWLLFEILEA